MNGIWDGHLQRVTEYGCSLRKADAMLRQVGGCLGGIPLEFHAQGYRISRKVGLTPG